MTVSLPRQAAAAAATAWSQKPEQLNGEAIYADTSLPAAERADRIFGCETFDIRAMRERLPKNVFKSIQRTIQQGEPLDVAVADVIAAAMKDWATERGATHYTHWFQPLTGPRPRSTTRWSCPTAAATPSSSSPAASLVQGEPDASSFPSGGLRATFEARGYTAWDPTSPAFIIRGSELRHALHPDRVRLVDRRGARQEDAAPALDRCAERAGHADPGALRDRRRASAASVTTLGSEQEYFLVDREPLLRPPRPAELRRTLFGAKPPKGQELDDHYFGSIPPRVNAFMADVERRALQASASREDAPQRGRAGPVRDRARSSSRRTWRVTTRCW